MTDRDPPTMAFDSVERLPAMTWPWIKVEAPTARFPVVEIELPTNKGPVVEMEEVVCSPPFT